MRLFHPLSVLILLSACASSASTSPHAHSARDVANGSDEPAMEPADRDDSAPETQDQGPLRSLESEGPEGVRGAVSVLVGDFMPPHDSPMTGNPSPNAPVHVLRGRHQPTENIDRRSDTYVGTTTTDAEGRFQIALPPGIYTVVTEVDGRPYLNGYDGSDGAWASITVVSGEWTLFDIQDSSRATF